MIKIHVSKPTEFWNFRIENFKMIKQNRKLLLNAKYKLINFVKKKIIITEKKCVGHFQWVSRVRGKQKLFYFGLNIMNMILK